MGDTRNTVRPPKDKDALINRILIYLYNNRERNVPQSYLYEAAKAAGYSYWEVRDCVDKKLRVEPNIGIWWDTKERTEYYRWYRMGKEQYDERKRMLLEEF